MKIVPKADLFRRFKGQMWFTYFPIIDGVESCTVTGEYFEVDEVARLYVPCDHPNAALIADAYVVVWAALPPLVKQRLIQFWRATIFDVPAAMPRILIDDSIKASAYTTTGNQVSIHGGLAGQLPKAILYEIIAHEFGHMWCYTYDDSLIRRYRYEDYKADIELEADRAAEFWGTRSSIKFTSNWRAWGDSNPKIIQPFLGEQTWSLPMNKMTLAQIDPATRN